MTNVLHANRRRAQDWPYTDEQMRQMMAAVQREAYPPAQRTGIGSVVRAV